MHPEQIKAAMRMAGTTPAMLCDELGVAASSVSQAISGHIKSQRIQGRIAQIIGKPISEIWPNQITLRRSRAQIEAQRARAAV
ncbi:helix-turn-helix domain-containing protein [Comamonas denitrificans]|uniref:Helix-turn-helix domain-containing protein n=1 Tax=Comamonas denitrificans TaxID=117506 RepID=A0A939KEH2_9BURK|nr:helix-turn-helix domain-containing protein [Comamonas denitrificans]MBO1249393.1 helix-turn-helix domain-containing protein [Comamonas denitrificans]